MTNRDRLNYALSLPNTEERKLTLIGLGFTYNKTKGEYELIKDGVVLAWVNEEVI